MLIYPRYYRKEDFHVVDGLPEGANVQRCLRPMHSCETAVAVVAVAVIPMRLV